MDPFVLGESVSAILERAYKTANHKEVLSKAEKAEGTLLEQALRMVRKQMEAEVGVSSVEGNSHRRVRLDSYLA